MVRRDGLRKRGCNERPSFEVNKANKERESDKGRRVRRANENGGRRYSRHANSFAGPIIKRNNDRSRSHSA